MNLVFPLVKKSITNDMVPYSWYLLLFGIKKFVMCLFLDNFNYCRTYFNRYRESNIVAWIYFCKYSCYYI